MRLEFCTIASGSSGNCTYIGSEHTKILIDAGISGKKIEEGLAELKLTGDQIDALFITHEHADHIKGAGILSRRFDIPIFATAETWAAMEGSLGKIAPSNKRIIYADEMCPVNDICVRPFEIPHDASEPVGYSVFAGGEKLSVTVRPWAWMTKVPFWWNLKTAMWKPSIPGRSASGACTGICKGQQTRRFCCLHFSGSGL